MVTANQLRLGRKELLQDEVGAEQVSVPTVCSHGKTLVTYPVTSHAERLAFLTTLEFINL